MLLQIAISVLDTVAISADVVDLLKVLFGVHVRQSAIFIAFDFADDLLDERVLQHDISEALMMHSLEHGVVVGACQAEHVEKVEPQLFEFRTGDVNQFEILGDRDDHLIESHWALRILLYVLLLIW